MTTAPPSPAGPAAPAGARARAAVLAFALVLPGLALLTAAARGPLYLEINTDPEYAYLLNSLLLAEGRAPCHSDHPGTPVQLVGAGAIRALHLARGGPLQDNVLLNPEAYLGAIRVAVVAAAALLSALGGALALRATGWVGAAAMVQLGTLACFGGVTMLDRAQPEPLLIGLGIALSGAALCAVHRGHAGGRGALAMGALVGLGVACKVLFAPAALVPLAAVRGQRRRALVLAAAGAVFFIATLPVLHRLAALAEWLGGIMTRGGPYGRGEREWVSPAAYLRNLADLAASEPLLVAVAVAGLVVAVAHGVAQRRAPAGERCARRTLAAAAAAQLLLLLVVARHPSARYLVALAGLSGLILALGAGLAWPRPGRVGRRRVGAALAAGAVLMGAAWQGWNLRRWVERTRAVSGGQRLVAEFLAGEGGRGVVHGLRVSSAPSALQFGSTFACDRFGADLARLYPHAVLWDARGVHRFGEPAPAGMAGSAGAAGAAPFQALVSGGYGRHRGPDPADLEITTERVFERERLIVAAPARRGPGEAPDFWGFRELGGLDRLEGPFPRPPAPIQAETVRWGLGPATRLRFTGGGEPLALVIEGRPAGRGQSVEVFVDGAAVGRHEFASPPRFERWTVPLPGAPGERTLELRYADWERADWRSLAVLYRKIQVVPATGGRR